MAARLRILQVMRAPVGGLFRHVRDLATAQAAGGHLVGVVCDSVSGDRLTEERLEALQPHLALGLHRFPMSREIGWKDPLTYIGIRDLAARLDVEVLHGHGAKGGAFARLVAGALRQQGHGPAAFYTPHGGSLHFSADTLMGRIVAGLERRLLAATDALIFESAHASRIFAARIAADGVTRRVIHNGLHESEFEPAIPAGDAAEFLFLGELAPIKGVDVLLQALRVVNDQSPARALIVGDGSAAADLRRLCDALGLGSVVTFAGAMPIRQAFARGRCLVMPSRAESLPYVALETAAAGVPLIATQVGGIAEIAAGTDTRLVPPGEAQALASAMLEVLHAPQAAQARALRLRSAVRQRFTVETMTEAVLELYAMARARRAAA